MSAATLKSGNLGSATGVWQFLPATFHRIVKLFGAQLLAASEADAATGRQPMDLGAGPFTDAKVRRLIRETVDGQRGADDAQLQLLRHNFAVLAFAKHYLSLESGAATPEEDYLFHFLGEGQGRRILALARGEVRHTLCVKRVGPPAQEPGPELLAGQGALALPPVVPGPARLPSIDALTRPPVVLASGPKPSWGRPRGAVRRQPRSRRPRDGPSPRRPPGSR